MVVSSLLRTSSTVSTLAVAGDRVVRPSTTGAVPFVPLCVSTINLLAVAFSTEWRSMSSPGQARLGDNGRLSGGRITRSSYPCTHCHMSFSCDAHRGRHMQASHSSLNRLVGTSIEPSTRRLGVAGATAAAASGEIIVVDADSPPRCDGGGVAANGGQAADGGQFMDIEEKHPTHTRAAAGAGRLTGAYVGADGMERGRIGAGVLRRSANGGDDNMVAEYLSIAARIREYYNDLPEVSKCVPVVDPAWAERKSRFSTKALRRAFAFSLTAGGCGMSESDHLALAHVLFDIEAAATVGGAAGAFTATFPTANSFLTETKHEQRRVLALRQWMKVPIVLGERTFKFYFRDALDAGLDALKSATEVSFGPEERQTLEGDSMSRLTRSDCPPPAWEMSGRVGPACGSSGTANVSDGDAIGDGDAAVRDGTGIGSGMGAAAVSRSSGMQGLGGSDGGSDEEIMPLPRSRRTIVSSGSGSIVTGTTPGTAAASGASVAAFRASTETRFLGQPRPATARSSGTRQHWPRRGTLDSDLYCNEAKDVKRIHGENVRVMAILLHADEALVSWSGAHHIFPVRARYANVLDDGGAWVTIGYVEHVPKADKSSAAARLEVSDIRNDLLQRCLAIALQKLIAASATGVSAEVAGHGMMRLVPRVVGLVVDQVEERNLLCLMGNQCNFYCSHCMISRLAGGGQNRSANERRPVVQVLEAQLAAALVRRDDPRPGLRKAIGDAHSALAFVPVLGAMHGLSTGGCNLYDIVSFDVLHVWKLGVLRMLAQRLPAFLESVCGGKTMPARLGSVQVTMDTINQRGFHLGRLCKASPSTPGYVSL